MVAVNLSGSSLCDPEFRAFAEERMRALACPNVLCLEITDGEAITDFVAVNAFIARARALGCRFALDDFGSGLSSFAYLRRLPVDYVKIDGQFVRDASTDSVSLAMVEAIHRLRSEERRVGKDGDSTCRVRWGACHNKKKKKT